MSPLRWFRRHATWMLIIFGVVLMAIFGLGPVFDRMTQGFQNSAVAAEDPVIIKYRGGEITRSKLDELQRNHFATRRFLMGLVEQAQKQCEEKEVQFRPLANMVPGVSRQDDNDVVDEQMLVRKLLAERAEDEGVVVSDGMVNDYLSLLGGQADFSDRDLRQINKLANPRMGMMAIRNHLKLELKAMQMQQYTAIGVPVNPVPTEAVELYARANNRIECEYVPVSVDEYVGKISGEPSNAELKALYAEGKYEYEDAGKQKPGFKIPRKVNVQYFVADMQTFLQKEKNKLTDAAVEAEYDKLVAAEDPLVVEVVPQGEMEGFELDLEDEEKSEDSSESGDSETETEDTKTATDDAKSELPTETGTADSAKPSTEEKPETNETSEESGDNGSDQSLNVSGNSIQFVSYVQDEEQPGGSDPVKIESKDETPAETTDEPQEEEPGGLGDLQLSDEAAGPQASDDASKVKIKPLSEVADQIRDRMARNTAFEKKNEAAKRAMVSLQNYQNQVLRWDAARDDEKASTPKPEPPDFEAIAAENGLTFGETGLVEPSELRQTEFGKVNYPVQVRSPQGPVRMDFQSVSNKVFFDYDRLELLVPQEVSDILTANSYVYWLSEKVEVRIPEMDEAAPKIKEYWRYQQAVDQATAAAEKIAASVTEGKMLTELYPETAFATGEFTWFSPGRGAMATYGRPYDVKDPGEEFMETAFSLKEGEVGVAANASRNTIYVIQRTTAPASIADSGKDYLDNQYFRFKRIPTDVMGAAQLYAQELEFDWRDEFVKTMELKRMK